MIILKDVETEFLIEELKLRGYIRILWHRDDIEQAILNFGKEPTPEAIDDIVDIIEDTYDTSVGISWDQIGVYVHEYFNPREES